MITVRELLPDLGGGRAAGVGALLSQVGGHALLGPTGAETARLARLDALVLLALDAVVQGGKVLAFSLRVGQSLETGAVPGL